MTSLMPAARLEARKQRWFRALPAIPYVLLAFLTVFTVAMKHSAGRSLLIDLALCAFEGAWMLWM